MASSSRLFGSSSFFSVRRNISLGRGNKRGEALFDTRTASLWSVVCDWEMKISIAVQAGIIRNGQKTLTSLLLFRQKHARSNVLYVPRTYYKIEQNFLKQNKVFLIARILVVFTQR